MPAGHQVALDHGDRLLPGGGEMGRLVRAGAWPDGSLGPIAAWPQSLRAALGICLGSRFPIVIYWGPGLLTFYNDAYAPILASKHPWALGRPCREVWAEIWDVIGPQLEGVLATGEATWSDDQLLLLRRHGYAEECYFSFSFSPIRDEHGAVSGIFTAVTENTQRVVGERRLRTLRELAARSAEAKSVDDACRITADILDGNPADVPFSLLYLADRTGDVARLVGASGVPPGTAAAPAVARLDVDDGSPWPLAAGLRRREVTVVDDVHRRIDGLPGGPWSDAPSAAVVVPVAGRGDGPPVAVLVAGVSTRRPLDRDYRTFFELVAGHAASAIANADAHEAERRRAEALAELDRAKTAFFSNVSHEFRTPLTLLLGPLEDALADGDATLPPAQRTRVDVARRGAVRLLKLVNTLLDFSRIEAGRADAAYEATELPVFTAELASVFRSAVERAGMRLVVDCPPLRAPVWVDRTMWEKIVFNLLSNAFKFTFDGEIVVALRERDGGAELEVRDTGVGIPASELPHVFERFHRIRGTRARTQEGTGIGLALVQELVRLHGGSIAVASTAGGGTTFTVRVPFGSAHLPADRLRAERRLTSTAIAPEAFVDEALRWLPASPEAAGTELPAAHGTPTLGARDARVLVADDNADMRAYLARLLGAWWTVEAVADGRAALEAARERRPNLVLADVMMPGLDGFEVLRALRGDPETRTLPVLLLSARAGEEARVEGLSAGADDYLVKPFSARELVARVGAHLDLARVRDEALAEQRRAEAERVRLLAVAEQSRADAEHRLRESTALVAASRELSRSLELDELLDTLCRLARELVAADGATFVLRDGDEVHYVAENAVGPLWKGRRFPIDRCVSGWAIRRQTTAVVEDVDGDDRLPMEPYRGTFVRSFVIAPVGRDETLAAMGVYWAVPRRASDDEVRLLNALADLASVAVANARLFEQREKARDAAEQASRAKDEFLAMLGHELRNPLAAVRNAIVTARLDAARGARALEIASRGTDQLARLIDDLLDVARITQGRIVLRKEPTFLAEIIGRALESTRGLAEGRGHVVHVGLPGDPPRVDADPVRLEQVIVNLLTNAVKYTDPGGRIDVLVERDGADVVLRVRDTGIGIPAAMLPHVFDLFTQGERALDRAQGGLGIGLTLVKRLVELHGGGVDAHSDGPGSGAEFVVRLPALVPAADGSVPVDFDGEPSVYGVRVLLVEDNLDAAESLAMLLELLGHRVDVAYDGTTALDVARRVRPEIMLVDIGLPGIDGYEVARRVRRDPAVGGAVLVALTGYGRDEDRRRALAAGFDHHLAKPVDIARLQDLVDELARDREAKPTVH